jgi:hypothetical protein
MPTRRSVRLAGAMVVSLSWAGIISPRPLKRDTSTLPRPENSAAQQLVLVGVVAGIGRLCPLRQPVERRHGEIEVAGFDQLRHLAEEEGDEQRGDMGAVDVGVGHDDDLVVAQAASLYWRPCRSRAPG